MKVVWKEIEGEFQPTLQGEGVEGQIIAWAPQAGAQPAFLSSPVFETLLEGPRGTGKTDCLLMDFGQHVGQGLGMDWSGILFRQTFPQLTDIISKTKKWFPRIWPQARFNEQKTTWVWPEGETLRLSYILREADYWNYHGSSYPWIGFSELTTWADSKVYLRMMSCCRSANPKVPRKYRADTNPYGKGHNWVKARFELPVVPTDRIGPVIQEEGRPDRVAIHSDLHENKVLLHADPHYVDRIREGARNPSEAKAWIQGSWDIIAGGMFDDLWEPVHHIIPDIPFDKIPKRWRLDRAYDHGQSKPFSVGWWLESNGEPIVVEGRVIGRVRGDLIRLNEWYGAKKEPNVGLRMSSTDIAKGILDREREMKIALRVKVGPADSSIFDDFEPGKSVAGMMKAKGVRWNKIDKGPGSRKQGWSMFREYLEGAVPKNEGMRDMPGLFVTKRCRHFLRTIPVLPRSDRDPDDADTDSEDHIADEVRYRMRGKRKTAMVGRM